MTIEHDIARIKRVIFGDASCSPAVTPAWGRIYDQLDKLKYEIDCGRHANDERSKKAQEYRAEVADEVASVRAHLEDQYRQAGNSTHGAAEDAIREVARRRSVSFTHVKKRYYPIKDRTPTT